MRFEMIDSKLLRMANRKGTKDAKEDDFLRIGTRPPSASDFAQRATT